MFVCQQGILTRSRQNFMERSNSVFRAEDVIEFFYFRDFHRESKANSKTMLLRFIRPTLEEFTVETSWKYNVWDFLLEKLSHECPKLRSLSFVDVANNHVSDDGLVRILKSINSLTHLRIRTGLDGSRSQDALDVITSRLQISRTNGHISSFMKPPPCLPFQI